MRVHESRVHQLHTSASPCTLRVASLILTLPTMSLVPTTPHRRGLSAQLEGWTPLFQSLRSPTRLSPLWNGGVIGMETPPRSQLKVEPPPLLVAGAPTPTKNQRAWCDALDLALVGAICTMRCPTNDNRTVVLALAAAYNAQLPHTQLPPNAPSFRRKMWERPKLGTQVRNRVQWLWDNRRGVLFDRGVPPELVQAIIGRRESVGSVTYSMGSMPPSAHSVRSVESVQSIPLVVVTASPHPPPALSLALSSVFIQTTSPQQHVFMGYQGGLPYVPIRDAKGAALVAPLGLPPHTPVLHLEGGVSLPGGPIQTLLLEAHSTLTVQSSLPNPPDMLHWQVTTLIFDPSDRLVSRSTEFVNGYRDLQSSLAEWQLRVPFMAHFWRGQLAFWAHAMLPGAGAVAERVRVVHMVFSDEHCRQCEAVVVGSVGVGGRVRVGRSTVGEWVGGESDDTDVEEEGWMQPLPPRTPLQFVHHNGANRPPQAPQLKFEFYTPDTE